MPHTTPGHSFIRSASPHGSEPSQELTSVRPLAHGPTSSPRSQTRSAWSMAALLGAGLALASLPADATELVTATHSNSTSSARWQDAPPRALPAIGFEADTIDEDIRQRLAQLTAQFEAAALEHHVAGMALAIVKDDEILFARGFGHADREQETLVTPHTTFGIGSVTKSFTAALVAMLVDEGLMQWDDPLEKYLPYYTLQLRFDGAEAAGDAADRDPRKATLADALSHRTGFTRMTLLILHPDLPVEQRLRTAANAEPWDAYRANFHYTNIMYLAAGQCAVVASGDPDADWHSLIEHRLLRPLGMPHADSRAAVLSQDLGRAKGYRWRTGSEQFEPIPWREPDGVGAAGAIHANVMEMTQWLRFQLNGGAIDGTRLISREALETTWQPHNDIAGELKYGLGWMIESWQGRRVIQHGGNIDGYSAMCAFMPEENLGFVFLSNVSFTALQELSRSMVWEALLGDRADDDNAGAADGADGYQNLVGEYTANFGALQNATLTVLEKDGKLAVDVPGQMVFELRPPDEQGLWKFAITDAVAVSFERDESGQALALLLHQGGMKFEALRKGVEIKPEIPLGELDRFLGRYTREGVTMQVVVQNNRLAVDVPMQMVYELHTPDEDGWRAFRATDLIRVRFNEDEEGRCIAMVMSQGGMDLEYARSDDPVDPLPSVSDIVALRQDGARRAAVHDAGIVHMTGSMNIRTSGVRGTMEVWARGLDEARSNVDFSPWLKQESALSGNIAEERTTATPYERQEGIMLKQARLGHPLTLVSALHDSFDTIRVVGREEDSDEQGEPRKLIVVEVARDELPTYTLYLGAATGDVVRMDAQMVIEGIGALPVQQKFSDFRDIDGLRIPFRSEISSVFGGLVEITIDTVTTNASAGRSIFRLVPADVFD